MSTRQRTFTAVVIVFAVVFALALVVAPFASARKNSPSPEALQKQRVERGEYIVMTSGCHDCHTPWKMGAEGPEPDMSLALSGHPEALVMPPAPDLGGGEWVWAGSGTNTAFAGPWGVSFTANLTPEPLTGIGIWTEDIFINTIRSGRHWGVSRPILPPMPWQVYRNMTDEDLKSLFAYLQTLKPIQNQVPEPLPPAGQPPV
ncbi:MAG TPA: c-type cytochrome [Thermoanaerobaculia bacterium]